MRRKKRCFRVKFVTFFMSINPKSDEITLFQKLFCYLYHFFLNRLTWFSASQFTVICYKIICVINVNQCFFHEKPSCIMIQFSLSLLLCHERPQTVLWQHDTSALLYPNR